MKYRIAIGMASAISAFHPVSAQTWVNVWNGIDTAGLYQSGGGTVQFNPGVIRVSGGNGYLATRNEYTHYRARFEWNMVTAGGNSGYLLHILQDRVWPLGLECQTGLGDAGSLWTTGCRFNSTGTATTYSPTGPVLTQVGTDGTARNHFIRSSNAYTGDGLWNAFEIFVMNDSMELKINNTVVMRVGKLTISSGTPLMRGKMGLQIEGAVVDFRNWQVMDLSGVVSVLPARNGGFLKKEWEWNEKGMPALRITRTGSQMLRFFANGRMAGYSSKSLPFLFLP